MFAKLAVALSIVGLVLLFQNCSNGTSFTSQGELVAKGQTLSANEGDTTAIPDPSVPNTGDGAPAAGSGTTTCCTGGTVGTVPAPSPTPAPPGVVPPPTTMPPPTAVTPPTMVTPPATMPPTVAHGSPGDNGTNCDNSSHTRGSGNGSGNGNGRGHGPGGSDSASDTSASLYVCILEGSGSSQRVGITSDGTLAGQLGTPRDVCMTENACLHIVSKVLRVKSAQRRGFCPQKNPHVVPMTDHDIEASIALSTLKAAASSPKH